MDFLILLFSVSGKIIESYLKYSQKVALGLGREKRKGLSARKATNHKKACIHWFIIWKSRIELLTPNTSLALK